MTDAPICQVHGIPKRPDHKGERHGRTRWAWCCRMCRVARNRKLRAAERAMRPDDPARNVSFTEINRRLDLLRDTTRANLASRVRRYTREEIAALNRRLGHA